VNCRAPTGKDEGDDLKLRNFYSFTKDDLIDLPFLNEPEILVTLRTRFEQSHIFTNAGPILLVINPFDEVVPAESSMEVMRRFVEDVRMKTVQAGPAYTGPIKNHSILISGESGSGKTESFKIILNLFGRQSASTSQRTEWFHKILLAHKVLESFGNARTMHTANSSRFGKVVELNLTARGELVGSSIRTYLLESSRTANQQLNERNFNIFYELLVGANAEERARWNILPANKYHYTNQGGLAATADLRSDAINFVAFKDNLLRIGFDHSQVYNLLDSIVGILSLGEVKFEDLVDISGGCRIVDGTRAALQASARLFGVQPEQLEDIMTTKNLASPRGEKIIKRLNTSQANIAKDAIAKAIYRGIFDWLATNINLKLQYCNRQDEQLTVSSVMLVDIFGFDSFHYNSIDQLCINYANEVLQQLFNYNVFKREIELYQKEEVTYEDLIFSDNKDNIELISSGIFRILDDQCRLPDPTDKRFVAQLYKDYGNHRLFSANTVQMRAQKFSIQHFSGPVEYTADDFIVKNSDNLPADTGKLLLSAHNPLLLELVKTAELSQAQVVPATATRRKSQFQAAPGDVSPIKGARNNATTPSFVAQVKADLALLVKDVEPTILHYVRCIKPYAKEDENGNNMRINRKKIQFSQSKVAEQLRYGGVLEAIRTTRVKYRAYLPFVEFYSRYRIIANNLTSAGFIGPRTLPTHSRAEQVEWVNRLIQALGTKLPSYNNKRASGKIARSVSLQQMSAIMGPSNTAIDPARMPIGQSMIFIKMKEYETLEALRNTSIMAYVVVIQTLYRRHFMMNKFKKRRHLVELIQRVVRGFFARLRCRRLRFLVTACVSIQRRFRRRLFFASVRRIQSAIRCYLARQLFRELKDRKENLFKYYGPLITARELRLKRRKEFSGGLKLDIRNIRSLEARFAEYSIQEAELVKGVISLVSSSRLDDNALQGELEFDKLTNEIRTHFEKLRNEKIKTECKKLLLKIKLAEHLLKTRKLSDKTFFGRVAGPSVFKSFMNFSNSDIPKVKLNEEHGVFIRILNIIKKMDELKKQLLKENEKVEKMRSDVRTKGSRDNSDIDAVISAFLFQLKTIRKLSSLFDVLEKYYRHFITTFTKEYGDGSEFHRSFEDEKTYMRALYDVVRAAKRYQPKLVNSNLGNNVTRSNIYRVGNCPLKVDWKETIAGVDPEAASNLHKSIALDPAEIRNLLNEAKAVEESEVLKLLRQLEIKKREFNQDNLRVVVFDNIGYQYMPIDPGAEFSMNLFSKLLSGSILNARRLIKLAGTRHLAGKVAYYQAGQHMTKLSLLDVLYNPVHVEKIDYFSFSSVMLTCVIMGIMNLQPNHVLLDLDNKSQTYHISSFNNDFLLSSGFMDFHNPARYKVGLRNMNVLFYLPQMDEPIDADVRAFLTSSPYIAEEIVTSWLRDLYDQNRRYLALKSAGLTDEDFANLNFPFKLPPGVTIELRKRLVKLSNILRLNRVEKSGGVSEFSQYVTHHQVLEALYPMISGYYRKARLNSDFTQHVDFSGVVSYAYVYHECIDNERQTVGSKHPGADRANPSSGISPITVRGNSMFFRQHPDLAKKATTNNSAKKGAKHADDDDDDDGSSSDDNEPINESTFARMPSMAFNYDQIYVGSNGVGERIPGVDEEDDEGGMNDQSQHEIDYNDPVFDDENFEDSTGQNGDETPRKPSNRTGNTLIEPSLNVDQVQDDTNFGISRSMSGAQTPRSKASLASNSLQYDAIYEDAGGLASPSNDINRINYEYPPTPFQVLQKGVVMQRAERNAAAANNSGNGAVAGVDNSSNSRSRFGSSFFSSPTGAAPSSPSNKGNRESMELTNLYDREVSPDTDKGATFESAPPAEFRKAPKKLTHYNNHDPEDVRVDAMSRTIEEEGFEFINSLDWRDFADVRPKGQAEEFCEMMGKNLAFLETVWLNHINDWQLRALFKYWIRLYKKQQVNVGIKPLTREVILRYNRMEDMESMKDCIVLIQLKAILKIDLKFAVLSTTGAGNRESKTPTDQYDIYAYVPPPGSLEQLLRQSFDREKDQDDDLLNFKEREISRKLLRVLWSVLNIMKRSDIDYLEPDIQNIKKIIYLISREQHQEITPHLLASFNKLLLEYPGLIPIGQVIAARRGFIHDNNYFLLHKLISHVNVERYLDMILSIAHNIPELFVIRNDQNELPCDLIKKIPEHKKCRYYLLTRCVNNYGVYQVRHLESNPMFATKPAALLTHFKGEEELLCVAAQFGLWVTKAELKLKRYDFSKRDHRGFSLLQILIIKDANGHEAIKQNCWKIYELLLRVIRDRVHNHKLTSKGAAQLILNSLEIEKVKPERRDEWRLCKTDGSRIMRDVRTIGAIENLKHHSVRRPVSVTLAAVQGAKF
jgi:myosin heavy subunit